MLKDQIKNLSEAFFEEVREYRRHLHMHPELSFKEKETAKYIAERLKKEGIGFEDGWVETGIVATIEGKNPEKRKVMLRADIDALPIQELNDTAYKSKNSGVMHACGHDVHTSSMLGAALILNDLREEWEGTVKIIFQPGEEMIPGGANLMIQEGLFKKHPANSIFGQHVMPEIPAGKVGFKPGMYMAACDELYINVHGKGGHGALPFRTVDPIVTAAQMIMALQQIPSRKANALDPTVLTIGYIEGLGSTNVIPDVVKMKGTLRTYNEVWRQEAHAHIHKVCEGVAQSMGATCEVEVRKGYPPVNNDEHLTERAQEAAIDYMGRENVIDLEMRPTGEDFSFYQKEVPGCFYRLGTGNEAKGITAGIHNPHFDIDEDALKTGMGLMAYLAINELTNG